MISPTNTVLLAMAICDLLTIIIPTPWYKHCENRLSIQVGRTWQPFVVGKNGHENFRQARIYNFRDKCIVFAPIIANLQI